ncbi:MAG: SDR family oxidoreductase [Rhodospirillaceae bacterium]|nr:SDR family oxidoreductase [Rhodospirillaceae bacterium]
MRFENKVALVTGGGGGFGAEIVRRFAAEGASVIVADMNSELGEKVAEEIGDAARFSQCDVRSSDDVAAAVALAESAFGGLDIIVNNAGIVHPKQNVADMDEATYQKVMDVNLKSVFLFSRYGVPAIARRGGGSIVNVASTASLKPRAGNVIYGVSKAAVVAFTKGLAVELAERNIRVNSILPVASKTQILLDFVGPDADEQIERIASMIPLKRLGTPGDMASAVTFLASEEASFLTGVAMPVDGGWTAG